MGPVVLNPGTPKDQSVRIYAHCSPERHGAVTILALNTDPAKEQTLSVPLAGELYVLTSPALTSTSVKLNGSDLKAGPDGSIPPIRGERFNGGSVRLAAASITFISVPSAGNSACEK